MSEIDKVYAAGSFGLNINVLNAARSGLLPYEFIGRTEAVGNAALRGAARALFSPELTQKEEEAAKEARVIELNGLPDFEKDFISNINFPLENR